DRMRAPLRQSLIKYDLKFVKVLPAVCDVIQTIASFRKILPQSALIVRQIAARLEVKVCRSKSISFLGQILVRELAVASGPEECSRSNRPISQLRNVLWEVRDMNVAR